MPSVQFFERGPSRESLVSSALGQAVGGLGGQLAGQMYGDYRAQSAADKLRQQSNQPGQSPQDLLFNLIEASRYNPQIGKSLGPLYQTLLTQMQAEKGQGVVQPGELLDEGMPYQKGTLPQFGQQNAPQMPQGQPGQGPEFFPNIVSGQQAPGSMPQQATKGIVKPVFSPSELTQKALILANERNKAKIPTSPKEAYAELSQQNEENKLYNQGVESELQRKIAAQEKYGEQGRNALTKIMPEANDEILAIFQKKGEEYANQNKSQADISRLLATDAIKFKNQLSNIENDLSAPRFLTNIFRSFLGNEKSFDEAANDMRVKLKPLLDEGLYDTARKMLAKQGFAPEERESIINPIPKEDKNIIDKMNLKKQVSTPEELEMHYQYTPLDSEEMKNNMMEVFSKDPNANLVLIRKAYEDKGYDWRMFKNNLNDLIQSDQIKLNGDQFNQLTYLDQPPLNRLEGWLHKLKLVGR